MKLPFVSIVSSKVFSCSNEVNLSSIETGNETPGSLMFSFCNSLTKITLGEKWKGVKGNSNICQNGPCRNTKNGTAITNDEDFEKLESDKYAGTWIRQASGGSLTCIAQRSVNGEPEDSGQDVTLYGKIFPLELFPEISESYDMRD